jgi:serine/threonine-protein kinase
MAEILLACLRGPRGFERLVVIKRILPYLAGDPRLVQMFVDEARNLAKISHPNVVQVSDFGSDGGEVFLAMEYVAGENLAALMRRLGERDETLPPGLAAFIVAEACAGLHAAHELVGAEGRPLGIVHRDISPQNILVTYGGHVKVVDFGIALSNDRSARSDTGSIKGKLPYMSPEQVRGAALDRRSDVFSTGIVLHELVTGCRLYDRMGHAQIVDAICYEPPVPPSRIAASCPARLDEICARALEKGVDDRYPSAAALRKDLLDVTRETADPTEALASMMSRLFAERIAEKAALAAGVETAGSLDELTRVLARPPERGGTLALAPTQTSDHAPPPPARPRIARAAILGAAALLLVASVLFWRQLRSHAASPVTTTASAGSPTVPSASDPPPVPRDSDATKPVVLTVTTAPPGARVLVDGAWRADTPAQISFPHSSATTEIRIERAGFQPVTQGLVMDRDQTLYLSLVASAPSRGPRPPSRPPPSPRPSGSGFWRFD